MSGVSDELKIVKPLKLSIEGVSKWFRDGVVEMHALDDVTLSVDEGEFVCSWAEAAAANRRCSI